MQGGSSAGSAMFIKVHRVVQSATAMATISSLEHVHMG